MRGRVMQTAADAALVTYTDWNLPRSDQSMNFATCTFSGALPMTLLI